MNKEVLFFTGGGSGGHVVPALTLIEAISKEKYNIIYIGSEDGIEANLTNKKVDLYLSIPVGKLRRYFSIQNFIDIFKVFYGVFVSIKYLLKFKSKKSKIISMGGFVSVPVVIAGKVLGIDVYVHEQTSRVGLANKIASYFAKNIFISFEESKKFFPNNKVVYTGYPVRKSFYSKYIEIESVDGFNFFSESKPLLFITGGGNGSKLLNDKIKENLDKLKQKYIIVHQVGKAFISEYREYSDKNYKPLAYIGDEMMSLFKAADVIISRAGAGTVCELMVIGKKSIFIPLKIAQKNEQFHNAMEAKKKLGSIVIEEDKFKDCDLIEVLNDFKMIDEPKINQRDSTSEILKILLQ